MALTRTRYSTEIEAAASTHGLNALLVESVVLKESSGRTDAYRFEPGFWRRYLARRPEYARANPHRVSSSYGLMQVMYQTAVERGFVGDPEELFIPPVGLEYGCRELARLLQWARGFQVTDERALKAALAAYNGGQAGNAPAYSGEERPLRNEGYAKSVMALFHAQA